MELELSSLIKPINSKSLIKFLFNLLGRAWASIFKTNRLLLISFINIFRVRKEKTQITFTIFSLKDPAGCHLSGNLFLATPTSLSTARSRRKVEDKHMFIKEIIPENKAAATRQDSLELKPSCRPQQPPINEE